MLAACVASLAKLGVDHLVAVDGAYQMFPGASGRSDVDQSNAVVWTAESIGVGLTLHQPFEAWRGNEVAKRSAMFRLATSMLTADDWVLVIDADEVVRLAHGGWRAELEATDLEVASVTLESRVDALASDESAWLSQVTATGHSTSPARRFFRALGDLRVERSHYTYLVEDRVLWSAGMYPEEDALDLAGARGA
jgi:PAS domain-containing protein